MIVERIVFEKPVRLGNEDEIIVHSVNGRTDSVTVVRGGVVEATGFRDEKETA